MNVLGLDIGGANTKAADTLGQTAAEAFAVWKTPEQLGSFLESLIERFDPADLIAVTMTAELADCFETKSKGVDQILSSVEFAAKGIPARVWQTGSEFVEPSIARDIPKLVAAANWHAQATWLGRMVPKGRSLLIDIGTTTTDIIPLIDGIPIPTGLTDRERLESAELVYSGVRRTPLCAIAHSVPFGDKYCPIAAELFATTLDVYLTLGDIDEQPDNFETANGQPATRSAAHDRLARMLCCDRTEFSAEDARHAASFFADVHRQRITGAIQKVLATFDEPVDHVVVSGSGSFLAKRIANELSPLEHAQTISLSELFDSKTAETACAFAVATLARERVVLSPKV